MQKEIEKLLEQTQPLDFIARCNILLSENKSLNIPDVEHPPNPLVYVRPPYVTDVKDKTFQDLLHDHILGHFDVAPRLTHDGLCDDDSENLHSQLAARVTKHESMEDDMVEQGRLNSTMKQETLRQLNSFSSDLPEVGSVNRSLKEQKSEDYLPTLEKESRTENPFQENRHRSSRSSVSDAHMLRVDTSSQETLRGSKTSLQYGSQQSIGSYSTRISDNMSVSSFQSAQSHVSRMRTGSFLELVSHVHLKTYHESHLETIWSALFERDSMWIAGWNQDIVRRKYTVLLNVSGTDYQAIQKKKNKDSDADKRTVLLSFGDCILYAKKGKREIFSLNHQEKKIQKVFDSHPLIIRAVCSSDTNLYILFSNQSEFVQVLDEKYCTVDRIATGLGNIGEADVNMCFVAYHRLVTDSRTNERKHPLVICVSQPASIRLITKTGTIWTSDEPGKLDQYFFPCSVSASATGDIFVVDRKEDRVSKILIRLHFKHNLIVHLTGTLQEENGHT